MTIGSGDSEDSACTNTVVFKCRARLRRSYLARSTRTIAALVSVSQRPLLYRSFKRAWMFIIFYFLACVFDIFALQNAVHHIWHLPRRASWHCVGWLLAGHWILKGLSRFKDLLSILGFLASADLVSMHFSRVRG